MYGILRGPKVAGSELCEISLLQGYPRRGLGYGNFLGRFSIHIYLEPYSQSALRSKRVIRTNVDPLVTHFHHIIDIFHTCEIYQSNDIKNMNTKTSSPAVALHVYWCMVWNGRYVIPITLLVDVAFMAVFGAFGVVTSLVDNTVYRM